MAERRVNGWVRVMGKDTNAHLVFGVTALACGKRWYEAKRMSQYGQDETISKPMQLFASAVHLACAHDAHG